MLDCRIQLWRMNEPPDFLWMCGSVGTAEDLSQIGQVVLVWEFLWSECRSLLYATENIVMEVRHSLSSDDSPRQQFVEPYTWEHSHRNKFDQPTMLPAQRDGSPQNKTNPPYFSSYLSRVYPSGLFCLAWVAEFSRYQFHVGTIFFALKYTTEARSWRRGM